MKPYFLRKNKKDIPRCLLNFLPRMLSTDTDKRVCQWFADHQLMAISYVDQGDLAKTNNG